MLPREGEMGENTPFTRKCNSEPLRTLEKVTTHMHGSGFPYEKTESFNKFFFI